MPTLDNALDILRTTFGFAGFRPGQAEIVDALLNGENVLAVMPTGSGKSLCYQLPALAGESLTVVVSPLIALMRDQVAALRLNGVAAGALNSATPAAEAAEIHRQLRAGHLRLLYVSPERLMREDVLDGLARYAPARFTIDEAHCISQWGHDFRPDYRRLAELPARFPQARFSAFTATADRITRQDIVERLFGGTARVFVAGFDRPNLQIGIAPRRSAGRQIDSLLSRHSGASGIVYTLSRRAAEETADRLANDGRTALPYHAGMDQAVRDRHQDRFLTEDGVVMVATIAFGMGIDKPDVRFVAHVNIPSTVEAFYQEIGRAGRDGLPAETLMLYGMDDIRIRRLMIDESERPDEAKRVEHRRLEALLTLCETAGCRRQALLGYFGEACEPCGNCDRCLAPGRDDRRHGDRAKGAVGGAADRAALRRRTSDRRAVRRGDGQGAPAPPRPVADLRRRRGHRQAALALLSAPARGGGRAEDRYRRLRRSATGRPGPGGAERRRERGAARGGRARAEDP